MNNIEYVSYKKYLKQRKIENEKLFIGKTKKSYIIGPKIDINFDENSFYRRIKSNCIYDEKIYLNISKRKSIKLINVYYWELNNSEVIEIFKDGSMIRHKVIALPGGICEKE